MKVLEDHLQVFAWQYFVYAKELVDSLDVELFTYNPTLVCSLSDGFKFDSLKTKQYNEENYVFAGYNY